MKHFDLENNAKRNIQKITLHGSILVLTGNSGHAAITINGFTKIATYDIDLDTTIKNLVISNYAYFFLHGFIISQYAGLVPAIVVESRWGWESINKIDISIEPYYSPAADPTTTPMATTGAPEVNLDGVLFSQLGVDFSRAKIWKVTTDKSTMVLKPLNAKNGDRIRVELTATSGVTVEWDSSWDFTQSTNLIQTNVQFSVVEGVYDSTLDKVICNVLEYVGGVATTPTPGVTTTEAPIEAVDVIADPYQTPTFVDPLVLDATLHKDFKCGLITDDVLVNLINTSDGDAGTIELIIDGTGGYTVILGSMFTKKVIDTDIVTDANTDNFIGWRNVSGDIVYSVVQLESSLVTTTP